MCIDTTWSARAAISTKTDKRKRGDFNKFRPQSSGTEIALLSVTLDRIADAPPVK